MLNASRLASILTDRYGVALNGEAVDDAEGQHARFRPRDLAHTQGFCVSVLIAWRTIEVEFTPGTFAKQLLTLMAGADQEKRSIFKTFMLAAASEGATVTFIINGHKTDPQQPAMWPTEWNSLVLSISKGPMQIDGRNPAALEALALAWGGRMLGAVLALLPLEPIEPQQPTGEAEGGAYSAVVTKYERSRINRAACIDIHGTKCKVCGFDFEKFYGPMGAGFIEVHHCELVARLAPGTVLDPAVDLSPLCSNCHSMAHRRKETPFSLDELRAMIAAAKAGGAAI